jgi:F420-0:gamma-glutamyl ligase
LKSLSVQPIQTRVFKRAENLIPFIVESVPQALIREEMVLTVTSKIVSLSENRLVPHGEVDKKTLVEREADHFLGEVAYGCFLTVKHGLFIPSSGIDESNSENGDYILFPVDPFASARTLWTELRKAWRLQRLAIVITDSHTTPLRRGVTGISLAHFGFHAIKNLVGTPDIFGRTLEVTSMNLADGLASSTVMMMGEGREQTPLAVAHGVELQFAETGSAREVAIPLKDDLYYPFFKDLIEP